MRPRRSSPSPARRRSRSAAAAPADASYRSVFENAVLGIFRSTPAGRLIDANAALARIYGYGSPAEIVEALTDVRRQVYVDPRRRRELDRMLAARGSLSGFEAEVYRKDRSRMWISISARAVRENGSIRYYEGTVEDISEHKRVEAELRRRNELLQTIFDHMPCMFNILGPGAEALWVNKEWSRVIGWTSEELQGCDVLSLVYADPGELRRARDFVRACGQEWGEFTMQVKDGRMVDASWANFRLSDGTVIGIGQDISERKRAHRALQSSLRQKAAVARLGQRALSGEALEALVRGVPILVAETLEVEGSGVLRLLAGGREQLLVAGIGFAPGLVGRASAAAGEGSLLWHGWRVGSPFAVPDLRADRRFRNSFLKKQAAVSAAAAMIGGPTDPYGLLAVFSRRKRAFSQDDLHFLQATANVLAAAVLRAEQERVRHQLLERVMGAQEEERRRIARELHDETGQAVASLLVRLRALEDSRSLRQAVSRAAGLRRLAARIIADLGRLARGLSPGVLESLGLRPALERLADEEATALGVAVGVQARGLRSARLPRDVETALYRIAQEAVTNAGKHAAAGRIAIRLAREDGHVCLVVRDDGRGFDPQATLRSSAANGRLGLHGMRERAALLGGTFEIESAPGAGTTVSVRVPVKLPRAGGRAAPAAPVTA